MARKLLLELKETEPWVNCILNGFAMHEKVPDFWTFFAAMDSGKKAYLANSKTFFSVCSFLK